MGYVGKVTAGSATHLVGSTLYGTCTTGASTAQKDVSCSDFTDLMTGVTIHVKFTNSNTATTPTLKVASTDAKAIYKYGTTKPGTTADTSWPAGAVVSFTYDGTYWIMNDHIDNTNTDTKVTQTATTTDATYPVLLTNTADKTNSNADTSRYATGVKVNPSTGNLIATKFNNYVLGAACEKSIGSISNGNTGLVSGGDVYTAIQSATVGSLTYGGLVNSDSDLGTTYTSGTYWIVGTGGGTIAGEVCEAGDMVIAHANYSGTVADDVDIVQANIDTISNSEIDALFT